MKLKRILSIMLVVLMLVGITNVYASSSRATAPKYNVTTGANATFTGKETLTFLTDGDGVEYIYKVTNTYDVPDTPNSEDSNDYVPDGWSDNPTGVSVSHFP